MRVTAILRGAVFGFALAMAAPGGSVAQDGRSARVERTLQVDVRVQPLDLQFADADEGHALLVYDLLITNWEDRALRLARLDVEDVESVHTLASYNAAALENPARQRVANYASLPSGMARRTLGPGQSAIVTVGIALNGDDVRPRLLLHRVTFEPDAALSLIQDDGTITPQLSAVSETVRVDAAPVPVLSPPLRGGPWRCANGLGLGNGHSAFYAAREARMRVPQRFGCDFFKIDAGGAILPSPFPNTLRADMFYGYGAEVLAVASGRVVQLHDGVPEGVPQADGSIVMPVPLTEATVAGNWIAIDIGGGRFAFYAHLQPGSLRVRVGDRVHTGQVIGLLGMSGNATGPHLHFHIGDAPSLNGGDGMPYVFAAYDFQGRGAPGPAQHLTRRMPVADSVMAFAPR